ncbi:MAG: hypothetical protein V7647_1123 [Acidobacteriota bacterium]|jgi:hypothetical protein
MSSQARHRLKRAALYLFCTLSVAVPLGRQAGNAAAAGHTIAGRVIDPLRLRPEEALLLIGREDGGGGSFTRSPLAVREDGSFMTPQLSPGTYVLELVRTPHSTTKAAITVGFRIVDVRTADVTGVTVPVRPDIAITGRFRMESDNPNAVWPPHIVVNAFLALGGRPLLDGTGADGAPGGKFVLRNAFGPRVLRCGYTVAPGASWWFSRVTLDGVDVTNVPTDFSEHGDSQLEVIFSQRPARISGTVTDGQGRGVRAPWVVISAEAPNLRQPWATTSSVAQGDTRGRFSMPVLPGRYLVRGVPQTTFSSWKAAQTGILQFAPGGIAVTVTDREVRTIQLPLKP